MTPLFRILVQPHGYAFDSDGSRTLMEAARASGILLPVSCRNGTCRTCLCRADGTVRHGIEWPGLSREEKQEGWLLPCVAFATSDLVLHAPAARCLTP